MALIQRNRLIEKLRRQFGLTASDVGATISDQIVGVVLVDDVTGDDVVSEELPRGAFGGSSSAAALGFFSKVGLQNPFRSGIDLFVESLLYPSPGNEAPTLRISDVLPVGPSGGIKNWRDLRASGVPTAITFDENGTVGLGAQILSFRSVNQTTTIIPLGLTLPPGQILILQAGSANVALGNATFYWIERLQQGQ